MFSPLAQLAFGCFTRLGPFLGDGQGPGFCGLRDPVSSEQGCALLQSVGPMDSKRVGSAYLYFSPRLDQTNLPGRFLDLWAQTKMFHMVLWLGLTR